ncbi:ribonuclease P protein component [Candidatus Microgenomates bacterium]|nr:ribonuclease P protein component [Candidatus Microgenomates bacterium]
MLPSKYRLKKRSSFARVELQGNISQFPSFGMGTIERKDLEPTLFGFVISTKISKLAVTRNKIKRILSDAVRVNYESIKPGYDVVFLVKPIAAKKESGVLTSEVMQALQKTNLLK